MTIGTDGNTFTRAQLTNYTDIPTSAQKIGRMLAGGHALRQSRTKNEAAG